MFCSNCGSPIPDGSDVCLNCGVYCDRQKVANDDGGGAWLAILSFLVPLAGFLIWVFCHDNQPKTAKRAGTAALIGFLVNGFLIILFYALFFLLMMRGLMH